MTYEKEDLNRGFFKNEYWAPKSEVVKVNPACDNGLSMKMSDLFGGGLLTNTDGFINDGLSDLGSMSCNSFVDAVVLAVNEHDKMIAKIAELEFKIEEHNSIFKDIYSACIGELTMGYKIDADSLGRHVYSVCGFNAEGKPKENKTC